ncbi:hypothetical protein EVAR_49115_1 [Eumeta japonica]|uniref:Uncharacterized protein n=1 Tax=Eumeta variegata TaxID=151549 RepID=A0A4C1YQZ0_EUMVA|nr:hypothetical protein EVAR_49115_1 [Eumeta japonica]
MSGARRVSADGGRAPAPAPRPGPQVSPRSERFGRSSRMCLYICIYYIIMEDCCSFDARTWKSATAACGGAGEGAGAGGGGRNSHNGFY